MKRILLLFLSLILLLSLVACGETPADPAKSDYDMSGITFRSCAFEKDGEEHSLKISGKLPTGVTVTYEGNEQSAVGEYEVTAIFHAGDDQHNDPAPMTATLWIAKKVVDVTFVVEGERDLTITIPYGKTVPEKDLPALKEKDAYWSVPECIYSDRIIKPVSPTSVFEISYANMAGATLPEGAPETFMLADLPLALPTPNCKTKAFVGWRLSEDDWETTMELTIGGDIELIAEWSEETPGLITDITPAGYAVVGYEGTSPNVFIPRQLSTGQTIVSVASDAFRGNETVKFVSFPITVTNIGNNAFDGCTNLEEVSFGTGFVKTIGAYAFANCPSLKTIALPNSLQSLGMGVFKGTELTSVTLPFIGGSQKTSSNDTTNNYIGYLFGAFAFGANGSFVPASLKTVTLSDACVYIPVDAFYGCVNIETIRIGRAVRKIQNYAFEGCTGLKKIYIPMNVEEIPAATYAYNSPFYRCSSDLVIEVGADSAPAGYGKYWNYIDDKTAATVRYGISAEE